MMRLPDRLAKMQMETLQKYSKPLLAVALFPPIYLMEAIRENFCAINYLTRSAGFGFISRKIGILMKQTIGCITLKSRRLHQHALQIAGVSSRESSFVLHGDDGGEGMQIDLIIDRADDVVNVCEMKFCKSEYIVTKAYSEIITRRVEALEKISPSKTFHPTLVSAAPVHRNEYSDIFLSQITIDDLFI